MLNAVWGAELPPCLPGVVAETRASGTPVTAVLKDYVLAGNPNCTLTINKKDITATAGNAIRTYGQSNPSLSCTVSGAVNGEVYTCHASTTAGATTVTGSATTTPAFDPASGLANYNQKTVNGVLTIAAYQQVTCFAQPMASNPMPATKSDQRKGSKLPVKCTLVGATGAPDAGLVIANASGDLTVVDLTNGAAQPLNIPNAFKFTGSQYMNSLDTSDAIFVAGHGYAVTAKGSDGNTSTGYFNIASGK